MILSYMTNFANNDNLADLAKVGSTTSVISLIVCVLSIVAMWKIFTKAGKPGWASIIPIYNIIVLLNIAGLSGWLVLLLFIPVANIVVIIMMYLGLAKAFGKSIGFAIGLILLNTIFILILGLGNSEYIENKEA